MTAGPMWDPRSEQELQRAAGAGLLEETHHLDLKRELENGNSASKSLAKDIAAFALDGGLILIGVDEDSSPPSMWPVNLHGLAERVEQIAIMGVDEPVRVRTVAIEAPSHPGQGYVAVHIPPSPRAPHMASGKYYGRGDKTNRILTHAEVLRLHERQLAERRDILGAAREVLEKLTESEDHPLLVVLAEPQGASDEMLVPLMESPTWQQTLLELVQSSSSTAIHQQYAPCLASASGFARRPGGVAITTGMYNGRRFENDDHGAEITFTESGQLILVSERAVTTRSFPHVHPQPPDVNVVFETLIIGHIDPLVRLAASVSAKWGFAGSWRFGLAMNGMRDSCSWQLADDGFGDRGPACTDVSYDRSTEASLLDLTEDPENVVTALVASLLRSLGSSQAMSRWLSPKSPKSAVVAESNSVG